MKLITLDTARVNSFALDETGFLSSTTIYSIILKDKRKEYYLYVLGILNSSLMNYYHKKMTIPQAGGFYRYQALFIKDLPIIIAPKKILLIAKQVSELLSKISNKNFKKTDDILGEIDKIVFDIYGVNEQEIGLIKDFTKEHEKED